MKYKYVGFLALLGLMMLAACDGPRTAGGGDEEEGYNPQDALTFGLVGDVKEVRLSVAKRSNLLPGEDPWVEDDELLITFDERGRVTLDPYGNVYVYDEKGRLIKGLSKKTTLTRDDEGRLGNYDNEQGLNDRDMRHFTFTHDAKGRLLTVEQIYWEAITTDSMVYVMNKREKRILNQTITGNIGSHDPNLDIDNENNKVSPKSQIDLKNLETFEFKIILIGDPGVGKTSIMSKFITNEFKNLYQSTLGVEFKTKEIYIDNSACAKLNIWDTCGQERFRAITRQYFKNSHGVFLVFDLSSKETIKKLNIWMKDIRDNIGDECVIFLIGNKADIKMRDISIAEEAKEFAKNKNIIYYEVSAKTGAGIVNVFEKMALKLINNVRNERNKNEENNNVKDINKNFNIESFNKDRGKVEQRKSTFHCC